MKKKSVIFSCAILFFFSLLLFACNSSQTNDSTSNITSDSGAKKSNTASADSVSSSTTRRSSEVYIMWWPASDFLNWFRNPKLDSIKFILLKEQAHYTIQDSVMVGPQSTHVNLKRQNSQILTSSNPFPDALYIRDYYNLTKDSIDSFIKRAIKEDDFRDLTTTPGKYKIQIEPFVDTEKDESGTEKQFIRVRLRINYPHPGSNPAYELSKAIVNTNPCPYCHNYLAE
jgi:hypothetical protein